jgi:hypothetical protein
MRTRAILTTLVLTLLGIISAGGCQVIAGLTVLQIDEGQGGGGGGGGGEPGCAEPCPMNYGCNPETHECNDHCTTYSDCSSTGFCVTPNGRCEACGISPPLPAQCQMQPPEQCQTVETCDTAACNEATRVLSADMRPARLVCNDQCNGLTVNCLGPHPCEVECNGSGCKGLVLKCSNDGPCKVTCKGGACTDQGVTMNCGENLCSASCSDKASAKVNQVCGGSCGCSKPSCQ